MFCLFDTDALDPNEEIKQNTAGKRQLDLFLGSFKDINTNWGEHSNLWCHSSTRLSSQFTYLWEGVNKSLLFFCFWKCVLPLRQHWRSYSHVRSDLSFREMSLLPAAPNHFFNVLPSYCCPFWGCVGSLAQEPGAGSVWLKSNGEGTGGNVV